MASDHEALSRYIQEKEDFVASVLERLRWTKEYLDENVSNMVQCPLDPGHWMPEGSLQEHIVKCRLNKEGIDFSAYECPVDTSYCYKDSPSVVQVHVDEACWKTVSEEVAKTKTQKEPLLASSREEIGPTAVWLDGTTPGVDGGEACGVRVVGEVEEGVWSSGGPGLVLRGEELGANQVKLVPVTDKGSGTVEDTSPLRDVPVPAEYDLVSRSVDERRVMYEHVVAVSKPLVASSVDASVDEELLSYDFDKEVKKLKRGVEEDDSGQQKSYLQRLAEQRNEKRRRQKYRSKKVYISNKSIKEIYKAIIDKRMAEFGVHSSLKHLQPVGEQQQTTSSSHHHQRTSGQRKISSEQGPSPREHYRGEGSRYSGEEHQFQRKDGTGCSEPACEDSRVRRAEAFHYSIRDQSTVDPGEGIKGEGVEKTSSEGGEHGSHRTLHKHKHKHRSRSQSHQRDHKRKRRNRSKDGDTSRPSSSSKRHKEEGGHWSGRGQSIEGDDDRAASGGEGAADGDKSVGGDDETGGNDRVGKGSTDDRTVARYEMSGDGAADGSGVGSGHGRTAGSDRIEGSSDGSAAVQS